MFTHRYKTWNGPMPTTAAQVAVNTGTTIKTMLQLATPATRQLTVISWGFSMDDVPGADGVIELLETDVAATVTAHAVTGIVKLTPGSPTSLLTLGVAATGFTASAEGAITATRMLDVVSLSAVTGETPLTYTYQFMPDERPIVDISKFLRVRITTPTSAVDLRTFVVHGE